MTTDMTDTERTMLDMIARLASALGSAENARDDIGGFAGEAHEVRVEALAVLESEEDTDDV